MFVESPCHKGALFRSTRDVGPMDGVGVGRGVGTGLLLKALHGFREAGLRQAMLEVTADNKGAIRLYRRVGFRRTRTIYKAVEAY